MSRFTNRKRAERANRYRVLAQQLEFHLATKASGAEVDMHVKSAQQALIEAAAALERTEQSADLQAHDASGESSP
jgi:hypothetical protein